MTAGPAPADARFASTRWTVVLAAGSATTSVARGALETLCRTYWYPLYAYARRRGADAHAAQDLVQGFFAKLIERGALAAAQADRGRFRTFLLVAFRNHAADEHARDVAAKRGGGAPTLSLDVDFAEGETRFSREPAHERTPEREFERRWALELLAGALERTRAEFEGAGHADVFRALVPFVGGEGDAAPYADVAQRLGTTEGAVKVGVHRLRARYREHLRAAIRDTVGPGVSVDEEIGHLLEAVAAA